MQDIDTQRNINNELILFLKKGMTVWIQTALELLDQRPTNNFPLIEGIVGNRPNSFIKTLVSMAKSM